MPDTPQQMRTVDMDFHYREEFDNLKLPDAYERLLLDVIQGDASLFPRDDAIDLAWQIIDPIVQRWQTPSAPPAAILPARHLGPPAAEELLAREHRRWHLGCGWQRGEVFDMGKE